MRTIAKAGEAKLAERRSRFLAFAFPVRSQEEVEEHLAALRRRFHDARHIVYAYRLKEKGEERVRADDAGEPAGSAGRAILQLLEGEGLWNVLVVVVRYFGGVKLGVGGLARAYREAARMALQAVGMVEETPEVQVRIRVPADRLGEALALAGRMGAKVLKQGYDGMPSLTLSLPEEKLEELKRRAQALGVQAGCWST
ncbi:MAG: Uncharacterized protein XD60_0362 [Acetothermia bacterium 64_32]|nr:MAG: Uncharacterized protein XD60_0362 [Acetothermia bacterium 64_32]HAF71533.1 YigZ family protein [Candidatus Acetothermia bacterium]